MSHSIFNIVISRLVIKRAGPPTPPLKGVGGPVMMIISLYTYVQPTQGPLSS